MWLSVEVVVERASICETRQETLNFNVWTACTTLSLDSREDSESPRPDDPDIASF